MIAALLLAGAAVDATPGAARAVVLRYYQAIEQRRYRAAWLCWSGAGRASGQTFTAFAHGFAGTAHSRVVAGPPYGGEAAAGSQFVSVPVRITATLRNGRVRHFAGSYTLRRVNGVPGATPAQLHWHLATAPLKRT